MGAPAHAMPPLRRMLALLMYKDYVPRWLRFWLIMMFALFYQLTGGVYVASISQMQGELAYWSTDVTMASYCSLIGLNMIFPILFRYKFYFYTRQMWFVSSIGCLVTAVLAMYVNIPWLFCAICFFAGYFKMMGMFACISSSQLNMTPSRKFGVFLPVIYVLVLGAVRISDIFTTWVAYYYNWKLIYCIIVVLMLIIDAIVYFVMKPDHRSGPFVPLKGIDWLGHALWVGTCIAWAYVFNYGEHYEWWTSHEIWTATWIGIVLLGLSIWRMFTAKDPFIKPEAFKSITFYLCVLLFGVAVILGISHYVQPIYVNAILGYDSMNALDLNYPQLAGIIMGAILAYFLIVRLRWSLRRYFFTNVLFFIIYAVTMYFVATPETTKEILFIPIFLLAMGEIMMETGATYALSQHVPFPIMFMNIAIIGFVRCGLGTCAGAGLVEYLFSKFAVEYGAVQAVRETFGVGGWISLAMLTLVLLSNFKSVPQTLVPKIITVGKMIKRHTTGAN